MGGAAIAGAACAVALWFLAPISVSAALTAGIAFALCVPSLLVAFSFVVALASRASTFSIGDMLYLIRALMFEVIDFNLAILAMMASKPATNQPPGRVTHRPVLLIHGFACNHSVWREWLGRLEAHGFGPVRVIDLEPPFADIEHHAAHVERELRALFQDSGDIPVSIIGHSMGGLVARAWLRSRATHKRSDGTEEAARLITIGTPHRGTWLARLARTANGRQMAMDSPWMVALAAKEPPTLPGLITSWWSECDQIVYPPPTAVYPGSEAKQLRGVGHIAMTAREEIWNEIRRRIDY